MRRTSGYTESELLKMQEDAIARVRLMQERARMTIGEGQDQTAQNPEPEPETVQPEVIEPANAPPRSSGRRNNASLLNLPGLGNLGNLFSASGNSPISSVLNLVGGDRIIIMVLILILLGDENSDQTLLLALCYLLLFD